MGVSGLSPCAFRADAWREDYATSRRLGKGRDARASARLQGVKKDERAQSEWNRARPLPPLGEEIAQQAPGPAPANAAIALGPVMAGRGGEEAHAVIDRAALRVTRAEMEPADAGERDRGGAHGAGLERNVKIAVDEALGAERGRGRADRHHLGMGGRIAVA